ncbi:MAG TPA: sigma-70 family RNA polymerase sigma factor [Gemmata sp.]|nr:sigma-70 family RNA polymerase sigma factor [Gemmata sp.]
MTQDNSTSLSLLQRIRTGDNSGWSHVVDLYSPLIYHWCQRWGVEHSDADDVAQEVFHAAAQGIGTFRREREGDTFRGWLRGITRHKVTAYWRSRVNNPASPGGSDAWQRLLEVPERDTPEDEAEAAQFSALYHRAVRLLQSEFEQRTWLAFWRTTVDEQPAVAVATELGMSANAVRMAKSRVLHRLREELGDLVE